MRRSYNIPTHRRDEEHTMQCSCVYWFRLAHPDMALRLVAVPNGGARDVVTGAKLKAEGVVAGVADLVLFVKRGQYGALCIEMKTRTGRQSESQKQWQRAIEGDYCYMVCRSFDEFRNIIDKYLKL